MSSFLEQNKTGADDSFGMPLPPCVKVLTFIQNFVSILEFIFHIFKLVFSHIAVMVLILTM